MTPAERAALDPDRQLHRNPGFPVAFPRGGEPLLNRPEDFARLELFLPRDNLADIDEPFGPAESDDAYLARAVASGCLITVSSAEVKANPRVLRDRLIEAYEHGVPLMKVTNESDEPPGAQYGTAEREQAKLAALAAARRRIP